MHGSSLAGQVCSFPFHRLSDDYVTFRFVFLIRLTLAICMYIPGNDIQSRVLRKTLCQNCNLMAVLVFRSISDSVRSRLKTLEDVVSAGIVMLVQITFSITICTFKPESILIRFHDPNRAGLLQLHRGGHQHLLVARHLVRPSPPRGQAPREDHGSPWSPSHHDRKDRSVKSLSSSSH